MKLFIKRKAWAETSQRVSRFTILLTRADNSTSIISGWRDNRGEEYITKRRVYDYKPNTVND